MTTWIRLEPSRWYWSDDEPGDPDFQLEFDLSPGDRVRLDGWWPYLVAQRVFRKPPHLVITPAEDGSWKLRANVGLSRVYRLAGSRLDRLLRDLLWLDISPGNPWEEQIRLDAHAPLNITLPSQVPPEERHRARQVEPRDFDNLH